MMGTGIEGDSRAARVRRWYYTIAGSLLVASALAGSACSETASAPPKPETPPPVAAPMPSPAPVGVTVQPSAHLQSLAAPPAKNVKHRSTASAAGSGRTRVSTANRKGDRDVTWIEKVDIDGDGQLETTSMLWDDEDKVLYVATRDALACKSGGGKHKGSSKDGGVLIAVYGEGNPYGKPVGSGWYAAYLDEGQCQAKVAGIYGCDFDPSGKPTVCGLATIDEKNDAIVIVAQRVR